MLIRLNAQKPSRGRSRSALPRLAEKLRAITKRESPPTIGVVTDDLVENNRDVRPLVRYVTGEKIRKGRSIARRAILATVIHYTLDAIYVSLHTSFPLTSLKMVPLISHETNSHDKVCFNYEPAGTANNTRKVLDLFPVESLFPVVCNFSNSLRFVTENPRHSPFGMVRISEKHHVGSESESERETEREMRLLINSIIPT